MTSGAELVCSELGVEEKCGSGLDMTDVNEVGAAATVDRNVGGGGDGDGNGNGNVGGSGTDGGDDDSTGVFVSGSVEMSGGDKSDSAGEVDKFKKEELGLENEGMLETNGIVHERTVVSDAEVKAVKDDVNLENESTVEPYVVLAADVVVQDVNGHLHRVSGEQEADIKIVEAKVEEIGSGLTFIPELTMNTIESSQVLVSELESAIKPSDVTLTQSLCTPDVITECLPSQCGVTVDAPGKTSEDLEFQVTAGSESSGSLIEKREGHATVDESGEPSEDLGSQVTADELESCRSPIKERECEVPVNVPDCTGSLVDNQECRVSVDESQPSGNHTEKAESNTIVMELDGKSEEHQELLVVTLEANVEVEPNHVCNGIKVEDKKSEGTEVRSGIESKENPSSGLVLSEEAHGLANGQVVKFDRTLEMGETQIYGTEADESSEKLLKVTESVEMEVHTKEMKDQVKVEGEIQKFPRVVTDNVQGEVSLETEANIETIIHENTSSQYGVSNCIDKPQEGLQAEASAETTNTVESECDSSKLLPEKDSVSPANSDNLTLVQQKVETISHMGKENAEGMDCGTENKSVDVCDDDEKETVVKDAEDIPHLVRSAESMDCATVVKNVVASDDEEKETEVKDAKDTDCESGVKNFDFPDEAKESEVSDAPVGDHSALSFSDTIVNSGVVIEFGSIGRHDTPPSIQNGQVEDMSGIKSDEIPNSSVDGEVNDAIDAHIEEVEVLEYNFLVKFPRFEDENFRDQIRRAQELVDEKTRLRDSIRSEILEKRAKMIAHNEAYNAAKMEETAARRLVRSKRQEIESVQAGIDRLKNAMSVEDIDARIYNVERMIQHETLLLKDEKQFIREIKQLKSLRDQLALNMATPEEIRQAIDMKDHNEERMMTLRKELDSLKDKVSKIEGVLQPIVENYEEESRKEIELQTRFRAADDVRQKAYARLNSLKKLSYDKNSNFRRFKEDLTTARDFASRGDKDALHRLCANQVETFMEQWNNNDEFRKEYVSRCNMIATRKQRVLDGGPLVPDDAVTVPPSNANGKVDRSSVSVTGEIKYVSMDLPVEQGKDVSSTELKNTDSSCTIKSIENVSGQKNKKLNNKGVAKSTNLVSDDMAKEETELAVNILSKEEIELARKAEELKKEENAAKLKEQRRLEEKAKAIEALERKKRNAEKAQHRAELRARKEAEQKEKEREKRLRKKEKKKTGDGSVNGDASSESSNEAKESTVINKKKTQKPPAHFFSKQLKPKPVPPPLINKNKKRWQQWGKILLCVLGILFVFFLANCGLFFDFKPHKFNIPM